MMPQLKPGSRNLISSAASAPKARIKFSLPGKPVSRKFYARDTHRVAKELLGKVLVRKTHGKIVSGRITEVEAYVGEDDLACHAARGPAWPAGRRTARTEIMYGEPGHAYIYLIYGMYNCLNIVTDRKNFPAAVLIRSLEPLEGIEIMQRLRKQQITHNVSSRGLAKRSTLPYSEIASSPTPRNDNWKHNLTTGPGKLTQALTINRTLNGEDLVKSKQLYVADDGFHIHRRDIATSPRIGVDYAGACALYPWRYYIKSSAFVSRR